MPLYIFFGVVDVGSYLRDKSTSTTRRWHHPFYGNICGNICGKQRCPPLWMSIKNATLCKSIELRLMKKNKNKFYESLMESINGVNAYYGYLNPDDRFCRILIPCHQEAVFQYFRH